MGEALTYLLGYDPSPLFSTVDYYKNYPDVWEFNSPALIHYIQSGRREGRVYVCSDAPETAFWKGKSKTGISLAAYCPESKWHPRPSIEETVQKTKDRDYVSFDVFDTLILRDVMKPTDIFRIMEIDCREPGFAAKRERGEQDCYRKIGATTTIQDVYTEIFGNCEKVDAWVKTEFSYELKFCCANPYMHQVYREVQKLGKPILIISDMYWPKEYLAKLLHSAGYDGWEEIFVSCDHDATKNSGRLQEIVWEAIGRDHTVIHFGDNHESDVKGSTLMGWDAVWYESCRDKSSIFFNKDYTTVPASIRAAICSNHLNNGSQTFSKEYEHGFLFGGMMV